LKPPKKKLESINDKIIGLIFKPFLRPAAWIEYKLRLKKIDPLIYEGQGVWTKYARWLIPNQFDEAGKKVDAYFLRRKYERMAEPKWQAKTQKALVEQTILDVADGLFAGRKDIERYFRLSQTAALSFKKTQQGKMSEAEINEALRAGIDKGTPKTAKSELMKKLEKQFSDGKVITINSTGCERVPLPLGPSEVGLDIVLNVKADQQSTSIWLTLNPPAGKILSTGRI